jgi:glycosyltransferase involved in cell wall biosynthesis
MSRKIRVATIVTRMQAGAGGVALRGALALDPDRYDVTILAGGDGPDLLDEAAGLGLGVTRVPSLVPQISPRHDRQALGALTALLEAGAYDVVHTHSAKAGALGRLAAVRARTGRIVHTFHGFPFHEFQSAPRRAVYVGIERWLGRRTDAFLAVGSGVAAEAVRRGIARPERLRTIGCTIDAAPYDAGLGGRGRARLRLDLPPGARIVGTVGRIDYQKAPEHFVDAIAALGDHRVHGLWIGDGPLRARLEARVRRHGLAGRFTCLGHRTDVPELLPALDVFAMASRYEGLPCALVEAMSAGVPVVATAVNAVPDVVVPGETGLLVPPERPQALAAAIAHLLDNPDQARRMARTALERLDHRFRPEHLGEVLTQLYAGPSGRRAGSPLSAPRT